MSAQGNNGGPAPGGNRQNDKARQVHEKVNEVVGIMQNNIDKVMERGERLDSLQSKTDDLQQGAMQFKRGATKVRKQMWWKDAKIKIMIAAVVAIIIIIIVAVAVKQTK